MEKRIKDDLRLFTEGYTGLNPLPDNLENLKVPDSLRISLELAYGNVCENSSSGENVTSKTSTSSTTSTT